MLWFVYIVECRDRSLYTGVTTDVNDRIDAHNSGKGAKYTRNRGPVRLVFMRATRDRSMAQVVEAFIKKQTRKVKQEIIDEYQLWCAQWGVPSIYDRTPKD